MKLSNSGYTCFLGCNKQFYYEHVERRVPVAENPAFALGTAVHEGLEEFWHGKDLNTALTRAVRDISDGIMKSQVIAMVSGYFNRWSMDDWETVSVEEEVFTEIGDVTHVMKADVVARRKSDGRLFLIDHKTVGVRSCNGDLHDASSQFWMGMKINTQATGYQVALENKYGEPVDVLWDAILKHADREPKYFPRKPTRRKPSKKNPDGESHIEYAARCLEAIESPEGYQHRLIGEYHSDSQRYFARKVIARTSRHREEWVKMYGHVGSEIARCKESGVFPANQSHCISKYGKCPYYNVCHELDTIDSVNYKDKPERYSQPKEERVEF